MFHLCEAVRLAVGDILAGQVVSPCPDRPVDAGFLHIHAGGQEFRPLWDREFRQRCLALQHKVCIGFQFGVLPRFCKPAVGEVLEGIWVILAGKECLCHLGKPNEGGIKGIDPIGHPPCRFRSFLHYPPFPIAEHLRLVLVCNDGPAFLADVCGQLCPLRVAHPFIGKFHLLPLQLYKFPAVGTGDKVVLYDIRPFHSFPDVAGFQGRGGGHEYFPVVEGLCPLFGQRDWVCLFFGCAGVFVHLIQKEKSDRLAGQLGGAVGADHAQVHPIELKL